MRKLYSKAVRVGLLWIVLLGAMAALTGTSAVALAENRASSAFACTGSCALKACSFPSACYCDDNLQCARITP